MADPIEDYGIVLDEAEPPAGDDFGIVLDDAAADVNGVETPAPAISTPSGLTNEELALRTQGPTVPLANGQSMLRSSITTDVAQGPVQFTSQGQPVLASSLAAPAVAKSREQEALEAKVRVAMEMGRKSNGTDLAQAAEIARQFNVPTSQVLPHLAQWKFAAESSTDDPADFIAKNRELVNQLADTPDVMAAVVLDPNVPSVIRALRVAKDMGVLQAMKNTGLLGEPPPLLTAAAKKIWDMANGVSSEQRAAADAQAAADEAAATERERNAKTTKFDNQEARVIRAAGGMVGTALTIAQRTKEAWYQQEMASGGLDLLLAEAREDLGVGDEVATGEALARVQNARAAARPLLLGDEGTMLGVAGDNMQAIVSTSNVLLGKAKAAGVLGAVLGVAGGVVGGIVGKGPGAREGAMLGAETGAKLGSKVGGFTAAFAPETGGAYLENRDAVTDEGRRFTKLEAAGGALVYGAVASWLENLGADEVMAPAAGALKARVQKLLLNDPMFRSRAADLAKAWAKGMLSEGGTEGLQSISEQLVSYAAKSLKDEKLQRGPAWSDEQAATEAFAGMWGGGVTTAASTGVAVTWEMVEAEERARTSPQQVALIATLAEQAPVQAAPGEFAKVVTEASGVTEFWVDVTGTRKYQEDSKLDDAQLELQIQEAGGQEALDSYKESLATGGKFQVPLTTALKTWLKSPLGQALLEHTSTSDSAPTPRQVAEGEAMAAIEAHAKELTEKAIAEMQDEQDFEDVLSKMEQDIADSSRGLAGISNPREYARDAVKVVRAQYSVVKSENPTWSWEQVVEHMGLLEYAKGDEAPVGQEGKKLVKAMDAYTDLRTVLDFGGKDGGPLSQEQAAELIFVDEVSNLRDPEAFDLEGVPEGMQVAMVTTPDAKAINDEPTGSHDATNALLRRMAVEVAKMDPRAARIGTNFAVRVRDQEQLDSLLEQLRGVLPAGVVAVGAVAQDRAAAQKAMDALVDKGRADGVIPPRGGTAFDLATLPTVKFDAGVVLPAPAPLTDALLNAVGPDGQYEGREKLGNRAFLDRDVPGLLSGLGFRKAKKGKFTVALDLRGLRDVNIALGKDGGNAMLRAFGEALVRLGGEAFAAAHLSGDEYAMTHDSQEALEEFIADLEADLQESGGTTYTTPGGQTLKLPVRFRWGIAEGTYGRADQDLNTRKRAEQAGTAPVGGAEPGGREGLGGARGDAREAPGAQGRAGVDLGARAGSVEQRNARALRRRGSERSRPFRDVAAELAAEQGEAGLGFGEDELAPRLTSFASPEVVAEARRWVGRMRSPARKARFSAWLDYAAGLKERPTPELFLERDEGVQLVDLFGPELDNPEGSFFDTPLLQGVEATKKTSRAEREQRRRARWNDAGMAENQASRMADANRARGKLDFDATGRRVLQEGADQGVAALPAGQPVPGRSDTSDFTALLSTAQREQGLRVEVQRMPGREESKPDKNGRVKFGRRFETLRASLLSKENPVVGEGEVIGSVAPGADGVMELTVSEAELDEKFQNQRLGVALYEALYRQALDLGAVRVVGGAHTPAASRVHQSLTRKHRLTGYEAKPAKGSDGKVQPYSYNLQPEHLYQSDVTTEAFKPIKLPSGLLALLQPFQQIGTGQDETGVTLVDLPRLRAGVAKVDAQLERLQTTAAQERPAGETPPIPGQPAYLSEFLRLRRQQIAESQAAAEAAAERGAIQDYDRAVHAIELEEREALWAAREFLNLNEDEVPADRRLSGGLYDAASVMPSLTQIRTEADPFLGKGGPFTLSEDDKQDLLVALDEFESQTGRLYQSDQSPTVQQLDDGRSVIVEAEERDGDRSVVSLVDIGAVEKAAKDALHRARLDIEFDVGAQDGDPQLDYGIGEMEMSINNAVERLKEGKVQWAIRLLDDAREREMEAFGQPVNPLVDRIFDAMGDAVAMPLEDVRQTTAEDLDLTDAQFGQMQVALDERESQTGRLYQKETEGPVVRPFISQAQRRYMYATNRPLAEKMRAITPPGPLPESVSTRASTKAPEQTKQEKQARRDAADVAADAILRGEKVPVQKTGSKPTIREVALALQRRQRAKAGVIRDFSPESSERIAEWMATEAAYEYGEQRKSTSGAGWYSEKFQQAMDLLAEAFPALKQKGPRTLMTAIIAITSDGQKVQQNLEMAIDVWRGYEATGKLTGKSWRKETANKLAALEELVAEVGIDQVGDLLLTELEVRELKRELEADGKKFSSGFGSTEVVPFAAGMFGPKLGVFFANLMGSSGYLTMDRWWNRTFNRYRGAIVPEPTRAGLERFKALLGDETMDDEQALIAAAFAKQSYEDKDYKNGTDLEKAGNTIAKAAFIDLNDRPGGATARKFMIDTAQRAVEKLKDRGIDLTVADLQAVLWYFEKRLYSTLGSKDSAEVNYEDAVAQLILNGELTRSEERAGPEGRAVSDARSDAAKGAPRSSAASARFRRLEARRAPGERQPVAGVEARFARVNGEEGSPAGHAGEVVLRERLYQEDTPSTPAVSPHKLSDGRSIVFDTSGEETKVALVDLEKLDATLEKLNKEWMTQDIPRPSLNVEYVGKYLRAGRFSTAVNYLRSLQMEEAELLGEDAEVQTPDEWGSKLEPFIRVLDVAGPRGEGALSLTDARRTETERAALEERLQKENEGSALDFNAYVPGPYPLSPADRQTFEVALDEFESQTGRLYQQDIVPGRVVRRLSDGRSLIEVGQRGDESLLGLVKDPPDGDVSEEWLSAALKVVEGGGEAKALGEALGRARQALEALEDGWTGTRNEVRAVFDGDWREWSEERRNTVADDWAQSRADAVDAATEAIAAATENRWADALDLARQAMRLEAEWGDSPGANPIHTHIKEAQAIAEAGAGDLQVFTLSEARTGSIEGVTPEVLVALDEYESDTGRMRQDDEKKASDARPPRGYFIPPTPGVGRVMRVFLNRRADRSTVFHESAHGFLEMQHNAANIPGVSQKTKDRWARIMKWLDVSKYEEIKTEHHERWAKAFELYTKEGRAPKAELTSTFARMKRWLTRIYGAATSIDGVELDPEVRAIFDSMLATEQEIARQAGKRGQSPWTTAEEAGMTEEQFAEYQAEERESLDFSTREAAARFTKASLRAAEADFAEMLDAQRAKAEAEYEALPGRKAQRYLEGQALDLLAADVQMAPTVLDRKAVENAVGVYAAKRFRTRAHGATMPDDVAPMVQFPTGKEMLQAIVALPVKEKWVEARAKVLAEQADPQGAADLQKLRDDVANGLQKYTEEKMARLWAEFGRRAEPGDDVSELGRQVALQALKKAGRMVAERTRVGRLNPRAVLAKERQAARVVREAVRKGNFDAARDWFRQQTLQAYAHGAVLDAIEERQRFESLVARLAKPAARARFGKADPRLRDALDYLLAQFGLAEDTGLTGEALKAGIESIAETAEEPGEWQEALQTPELLGSGDYLNLTVAQLRHLDAALRQLDATVRFRTEVMVGEKMADRAATTEALLEEGSTRLPDKAPPVTRSTESAWETLASKASAADGFLLNPADLLRDLAGDNVEGVWWKTIIEPMRRAKYREAELLKQLVEPVTKAMEALPVEVRKRSREKINGRKMFPGHIDALVPRERHELLMMALNVGNEGNLQRLTDGRKITVEQVAAALDTLTDAELAWVESVWDAASLLKDESFALEERLTGLRPRGVEPVPFRLPSGRVLKGGYFPAVYDSRASTIGQKQAESQLAALQDPRTTRASTPHSHVKARAEAVSDAAIKLDPEVIYRHLAQVAHDVAFRETIKSVGSILLPGRRVADDGSIVADNRVAELLAKKLGPEKAGTFMQWLKDVGGASGANVTPLDPYITGARGAFAHVLLGWKLSTAVGDFANLPAAVASTSLKAKHLLAAQRDCLRAPFESRAKALEASPWLRSMVDTTRQQFDRSMKQMLDKGLPAPLQWYKDNAFVLMETVSAMTATPVWMGAHRQAIAEGRSHEEAVRFADDILSQVFPSHSPVDVAGILRDRGVVGLSTVMYGYLSVAYRAQHRILGPLFTQEFRDRTMGGKAMTVANVTGRLVGFYIAFSVMGELLMGRGPEEGDEDKDDPENKLLRWRNWFMRKLLVAPASTLPFADLAKAIEAKMTGKKKSSARAAPLNTLFEMISDQASMALDGDQPALKRAGAGLTLMLEGLGLPVSPLNVQGKFLVDVLMGDVEPEGPLDVASGLVYGDRGAKQPANIFKP